MYVPLAAIVTAQFPAFAGVCVSNGSTSASLKHSTVTGLLLRSNTTKPTLKLFLFVGVSGFIILTWISESAANTVLGVIRVTNDIAIKAESRAYLNFLKGLKSNEIAPIIIIINAPNVRYVFAPVFGREIEAPKTSPFSTMSSSITFTSVPTNGVAGSDVDAPKTEPPESESPTTHAISGYNPASCVLEIFVLYVTTISSPSFILPSDHCALSVPLYVGSGITISVPFFFAVHVPRIYPNPAGAISESTILFRTYVPAASSSGAVTLIVYITSFPAY